METLTEFNEKRMKHYKMEKERSNGISCPNCGAELFDADPMTVLTSDPPQKKVYCQKCDYRGYRVC